MRDHATPDLPATLEPHAEERPPSSGTHNANFVENFDDNVPVVQGQFGPQNLIDRGWIFRMQSSPPSSQAFYDGYPNFISPQSGNGYLAADVAIASGGPVSNWAILPVIADQAAGDPLTLWLNRLGALEPRLEIRYSPNGGTSTGTTPTSVGDFTQLLLNVNPIPDSGWERSTVTLPGDGRIGAPIRRPVSEFFWRDVRRDRHLNRRA